MSNEKEVTIHVDRYLRDENDPNAFNYTVKDDSCSGDYDEITHVTWDSSEEDVSDRKYFYEGQGCMAGDQGGVDFCVSCRKSEFQ